MLKILNIFRRLKTVEENQRYLLGGQTQDNRRLAALEDYLDIEYFHGTKYKPHYRKRKVVKKKLGRPRKDK